MKRQGAGNGDPNPPDPKNLPPSTAPDMPDIGVELSSCLPDSLLSSLKGAIHEAFVSTFPGLDVRIACVHKRERIGIWTRRAKTDLDSTLRDKALPEIKLLQKNETLFIDPNFGMFLGQELIQSMAHDAWEQVPKRFNGDTLKPDKHGTVYLQEYGVSLKRPNVIEMGIEGSASYQSGPLAWIDSHLTIDITDKLVVTNGELRAQTTTKSNQTDKPFAVPTTVGKVIVAMLPNVVLIPSSDKHARFQYDRVGVSPEGVSAGGRVFIEARAPRLELHVTEFPALETEDTAHVTLSLETTDLRAPLKVTWDNEVTHQLTHPLSISIKGKKAGTIVSQPLTVKVKDVDGNTAHLDTTIKIKIEPAVVKPPSKTNNPKGPSPEPKKPPSARARKPRVVAK